MSQANSDAPQWAASDAGKAALGAHAKMLVEDPAFKEAVRKFQAGCFDAWCNSKPEEVEGRERLYAHVSVTGSVVAALNQIMGDGKISQQTMDRARGTRR